MQKTIYMHRSRGNYEFLGKIDAYMHIMENKVYFNQNVYLDVLNGNGMKYRT